MYSVGKNTKNFSVTIIVVNFNTGELLQRCLSALETQTFQDFETIVVDNASTDRSTAFIPDASCRVRLVEVGRNSGFAEAMNIGIELAKSSKWIAALNPDAFPRPDWLENLLAAAEEGHYDFFGSKMLIDDNEAFLDGAGDVYHISGVAWRRGHGKRIRQTSDSVEEIFGPCAAAALYRRQDLLAIGGFDKRFFCYFEDVDLAFRLRLNGKRCAYVPKAVVTHVGSGVTGKRSDFSTYYGQRNLVWTYFKNMPIPLLWRSLPLHLAVNLAAIAIGASRGQFRLLLRAKWDALKGLPAMLHCRRLYTVHWREIDRIMIHGVKALLWRT